MMEKKILYLNHHKGLSPRIVNEIKTLQEKNFEIEIICWNKDLGIYFNYFDFNITYIGKNKRWSRYFLFLYWNLFNISMKRRFDIIICTHFLLLPIAIIIGKIKKVSIIYDVYEMYSKDISQIFPFFNKNIEQLIEFIENFLISKIDGVITVDSVGNFLAKRYLRYNKNVVVLYNVPDKEPEIDLNKVKNLRKKYKNKKILIYVGGIFEAKGSVKALEALALVKKKYSDVKLIMIGKISDPPEKLNGLIKKLGIEENVEFIHWLPYEEMFCYLKIADVGLALYQPVGHFLFVSRGNGRKFFNYMQAGLPIIAPNFGEIGLVVKEEKCGILVDTTDTREIANAIIYLLEHPEEAKVMGERGKKAVEEKYNWEVEKKKLLSFIEKINKDNRINKTKM